MALSEGLRNGNMLRVSNDGDGPATLLLAVALMCKAVWNSSPKQIQPADGPRTCCHTTAQCMSGRLIICGRRRVAGCKVPRCCKERTCLTSEGWEGKDVHVEREETGLKKGSADRDAWHDSAHHSCKVS
jgi:hypothetical protein